MKKALKILRLTFVALLLAATIGVMIFTIVSVNVFNRQDRSVFGFQMFIVLSDSMSATDFDAGDLILTRSVDFAKLEDGDIITFISQNPGSYGQVVTHKIREHTTHKNGQPGVITYGTTTDTNDNAVVTEEFLIGKYVGRVPKAGVFFNFLKTPVGYLVCILLPFVALILYQGYNCFRLYRRYREEQFGDVKAEREKLEAERAENQKIMDELKALREQLTATMSTQGGNAAAPPADPPAEQEEKKEPPQ